MLVILFISLVYYAIHLDKVSYPLVALWSPLFLFFFVVDGVPMFVLPHGLTNEYIISIFISVASIFASRLITK